jgi:ADP-ribosylglycohydrolase
LQSKIFYQERDLMPITADYYERVYAGVLGKIIGVYLGRPFEGWSYDRIMAELGEVQYYVHEKLGVPLIVTDDDISGTFTFLRALPDFGYSRDITPAQIGKTWLNYLIEERTVLWWGGLGNSTEHTAYLRLKNGIPAPRSGSIAVNGKVVAEQIGAQIFIDGWAMVAPGDPEFAADLARRAASVSHDGEAIYGAQVLAAMESQAFVENDSAKLIDTAVEFIPKDSVIYRMIGDIREWHTTIKDWRKTRELIVKNFGYDRYGGNCHMVPNHALIILGLLYGDDNFQKTLMITNTAGWDTDCNSGNIGCLMGIKNGLAGINNGPDWRGPVADRLYVPTADGGSCVTDAVRITDSIVHIGNTLAERSFSRPKNGARFHFELPGSVQGFQPLPGESGKLKVKIENISGFSTQGSRSLAIHYRLAASENPARVVTPTFLPSEALSMPGYSLFASPTLYPGQTVYAELTANPLNAHAIQCSLIAQRYTDSDKLEIISGPVKSFQPGDRKSLSWRIPASGGWPIASIGIEIIGADESDGSIYLDYLTWKGAPDTVFIKPEGAGKAWQYSWVNAVSQFHSHSEPYRLVQNQGIGLLIQGTEDWENYLVEADITPHMVKAAGLAARVQGLERYYALLLNEEQKVSLVKRWYGEIQILSEADYNWMFGNTYQLSLTVSQNQITAKIGDDIVLIAEDHDNPLLSGAVGLVSYEGRTATQIIAVHQLNS